MAGLHQVDCLQPFGRASVFPSPIRLPDLPKFAECGQAVQWLSGGFLHGSTPNVHSSSLSFICRRPGEIPQGIPADFGHGRLLRTSLSSRRLVG